MAELLIKAVNATHSDPTKDAAGCYKRGDLVGVAPDGWQWGSLELKAPASGGKFVVIKLTDVTRAQVLTWIRNHWNCDADAPRLDANGITITRRRVSIDVDLMPNNVRNTLNTTGVFSTTWAAARQYLHDKLTNETATNSPIGGA